MVKNCILGIVILVLISACSTKKLDESVIDFSYLLNEMTNDKVLSKFPTPGYHQMQASSWDRSQTGLEDEKNWFANKDYNHSIREEKVGNHI